MGKTGLESTTQDSLVPSWASTYVQTPSDENARVSWAWKYDPAKIWAGQSELTKLHDRMNVLEVYKRQTDLKLFVRSYSPRCLLSSCVFPISSYIRLNNRESTFHKK